MELVEKALLINGPLHNMSDLLRVARKEGKTILKVDKVNVKPVAYLYGIDSYVVVVEPEASGCSKVSGVGDGKAKQE